MLHPFGYKFRKTYCNNQIFIKKGYYDKRFFKQIANSSMRKSYTWYKNKSDNLPSLKP